MNKKPIVKLHYTTAYQFYRYNEPKTSHVREKFLHTFRKILEERIPDDLQVSLSEIAFSQDDRIYVELEGKRNSDVEFTINILKELTGQTFDAHNVPKNQSLMGYLREVGKVGFGLFVDIGIQNPHKEALIPLHILRAQLANNQKLSINEIIEKYGFIDRFPVEIEIVEIKDQYSRKPKFEARLSDAYISMLYDWIDWGLDIVFTTGVARQKIKRTIAKRGHTIDVMEIIRLGPMEMAVVCNKGTNGPGLIAHIGKFIPHCRMTCLRPAQVFRYWG